MKVRVKYYYEYFDDETGIQISKAKAGKISRKNDPDLKFRTFRKFAHEFFRDNSSDEFKFAGITVKRYTFTKDERKKKEFFRIKDELLFLRKEVKRLTALVPESAPNVYAAA